MPKAEIESAVEKVCRILADLPLRDGCDAVDAAWIAFMHGETPEAAVRKLREEQYHG